MLGEYLYSKCKHRHLESFEALLMLIHGRPNFLVPVIQDKHKIGQFPSLENLFSQAHQIVGARGTLFDTEIFSTSLQHLDQGLGKTLGVYGIR